MEWKDWEGEERRGVVSVGGGGNDVLAVASRLQTGQKVRQEVSHKSTHIAWNSVKETFQNKNFIFSPQILNFVLPQIKTKYLKCKLVL